MACPKSVRIKNWNNDKKVHLFGRWYFYNNRFITAKLFDAYMCYFQEEYSKHFSLSSILNYLSNRYNNTLRGIFLKQYILGGHAILGGIHLYFTYLRFVTLYYTWYVIYQESIYYYYIIQSSNRPERQFYKTGGRRGGIFFENYKFYMTHFGLIKLESSNLLDITNSVTIYTLLYKIHRILARHMQIFWNILENL